MSVNQQVPDYDLDEMVVVTRPGSCARWPTRCAVPSWTCSSSAPPRSPKWRTRSAAPRATIACHVNLLVDTGLIRVVRTRRVRAIEERYYGRIATRCTSACSAAPRTSRSWRPSTGSRRQPPNPLRPTPPYSDVAGFVLCGPGPGDHHELGAPGTLLAGGHRRRSVSATSAKPPAIPCAHS